MSSQQMDARNKPRSHSLGKGADIVIQRFGARHNHGGVDEEQQPTDGHPGQPGRITVVIPTHNRRAMLHEAIDSVLASSSIVRAQDILVVDDSSSDGSEQVAGDAGTRYFRVALGEPGLVRNAGLDHVTTEYVWFLDDDDVALPGHPDRLIRLLDAAPNAGFAYGQAQPCEPNLDRFAGPFPDPATLTGNPLHDAAAHPPQIGCVVFRTRLVQDLGGFDPQLRFYEDSDLQVRVAARAPSLFLPEPLLLYRVHASSVMAMRDSDRFRADFAHASRGWRQVGIPRSLIRQIASSARSRQSFDACYLAVTLAQRRELRKAVSSLNNGIRLAPGHALLGHSMAWRAMAAIVRTGKPHWMRLPGFIHL